MVKNARLFLIRIVDATTHRPWLGAGRVCRRDHERQKAHQDEERQPAPGQLTRWNAGHADDKRKQQPLDSQRRPRAKGRAEHDQDETQGDDELDPRIEPVQGAGPAITAFEPPQTAWDVASSFRRPGKIFAIPQATPKTTRVPTRPAAAVASLTCSKPGA